MGALAVGLGCIIGAVISAFVYLVIHGHKADPVLTLHKCECGRVHWIWRKRRKRCKCGKEETP
jgi:hypothetical protein